MQIIKYINKSCNKYWCIISH